MIEDKELATTINKIPKLNQRQYSVTDQLLYLSKAAVKLGLYDADDIIKLTLQRNNLCRKT